MSGPAIAEDLRVGVVAIGLLAALYQFFFDRLEPHPLVILGLIGLLYQLWQIITDRIPSSPVPTPVPGPADGGNELSQVVGVLATHDNDLTRIVRLLGDHGNEITRVSKALDELEALERLLESYGALAEGTGTTCLESLRHIHKQLKEQLRQHTEFRNDYDSQLSSIVNLLDGHRNEFAEASQAAAQNNTSLCNIIGQYRQDAENSQNTVQQHVSSVNTTLLGQDKAIASVREQVVERTDSLQNKLDGHARAAEENKKLIKEHGAAINSVVSDHAELVAEHQLALDGMVSLNTANKVFSLIHVPSGWEVLGDVAEDVESSLPTEKLGGPRSGAASASMVDNVQELSRTFRGTANQTPRAPAETTDQVTAAMLTQIQDTVQAAVRAQHAEEAEQHRRAQEDIEKLRADLGEIEEFRQLIREREGLDERHKRHREVLEILTNDPERIKRDPELREEVDKILSG